MHKVQLRNGAQYSPQAQSEPELRGSVNLCVDLTPLHARTHDLLAFRLARRVLDRTPNALAFGSSVPQK